MGDVKTTMTRIVLILTSLGIPINVITIEIAAHGHLAIAAHTQTVTFDMLHHTVSSRLLSLGRACPESDSQDTD
jgi:hypothetical protein